MKTLVLLFAFALSSAAYAQEYHFHCVTKASGAPPLELLTSETGVTAEALTDPEGDDNTSDYLGDLDLSYKGSGPDKLRFIVRGTGTEPTELILDRALTRGGEIIAADEGGWDGRSGGIMLVQALDGKGWSLRYLCTLID